MNCLKGSWAKRGHHGANVRLRVLKNVLKPQLVSGALAQAPFPLVGQVRRPRDAKEPHLLLAESVFQTVMTAALGQKLFGLVRAFAIGRFGGHRGDLVTISRATRHDGRFQYLAGKRAPQKCNAARAHPAEDQPPQAVRTRFSRKATSPFLPIGLIQANREGL